MRRARVALLSTAATLTAVAAAAALTTATTAALLAAASGESPAPSAAEGSEMIAGSVAEVRRGAGTSALSGFDVVEFARALAVTEVPARASASGARVLVVPHYWPAGRLIVGGLRSASPRDCERVVLVGLDHHAAGGSAAVTSYGSWPTRFGLVMPDRSAIARLTRLGGLVTVDHETLAGEHSVAGLVPVLAYFAPGAEVVPLALRADMRPRDVDRLAEAIAKLADDRTLVVAPVDFAHYVAPVTAREMDRETLEAVRRRDWRRVLSFGDEHVDGRAALATALAVADQLGATRFDLVGRMDGGQMPGYSGGDVTSFVSGYFSQPPDSPVGP
ncbi:MAG: AmmeMemoRadiSam system protein B [Anaerolineae bacterium]